MVARWAMLLRLAVFSHLVLSGAGMQEKNAKVSLRGVDTFVLFNSKGVAAGGKIDAHVSGQFHSGMGDHPEPVAYLLVLTLDQKEEWWDNLDPSPSDEHLAICGTPAFARYQVVAGNGSSANVSVSLVVPRSDQYSVLFTLCEASGSFDGQASWSFVNLDLAGHHTQHLVIEKTPLPIINLGLACIYAALFVFWVADCLRLRQTVAPIHWAIALCLGSKVLETAAQAALTLEMNATGSEKGARWLLAKFSEGFSDLLFLSILLLVSVGWTLTRFRFTPRETVALVATFGLFVVITVFRVLCDFRDGNCQGLTLGEYILRSLVLLAIIVAMNFNITQLRQMLAEVPPPITPHMAVQYAKVHIFQMFRWAFLAYLLAPTTLLILEAAVLLSWEYEWVNDLLSHLVFLLIYVHVGTAIAPSNHHLLSRAFDRNPAQD